MKKESIIKDLILPEKITPDLAEETGLHIGDGSMNFYEKRYGQKGLYSLRGHIIDDREHYEERIKELYQNIYNLRIPIREMPVTGVFGFQVWSDSLVNFKNKILDLPLGKKLNVKIPSQFLKKEELSTAVIRGIYDTDGNLYLEKKNRKLYPRIEITSVSKELSMQIHKLLRKLNLRATIYTEPKKQKNWNNRHHISVRGEEMLEKFFKIIEPKNPKHLKKREYYLNSQ
ncbi:MAG: LAGLIDADG family homing endonuclease [Nanoarchaeota archaeon]|nr:LAGLIDADG family homing endonuclease [Nanoarchaeota archaeon]